MSAREDVELILAQVGGSAPAAGGGPELSIADIGDRLGHLTADLHYMHQAILMLAERIDQISDGSHQVFI